MSRGAGYFAPGDTNPSTGPFTRATAGEAARIADILRRETVGGTLLVLAVVVALVWSNSPVAGSYVDLRDATVGPGALHLHLTLGTWAADGLLAIFFFVAGLELKREFVAGDLRDRRRAMLPVLAAIGGVAAPALIYSRSTSSQMARRVAGRFRPRPTSPLPWRCWPSSAASCPSPCARFC